MKFAKLLNLRPRRRSDGDLHDKQSLPPSQKPPQLSQSSTAGPSILKKGRIIRSLTCNNERSLNENDEQVRQFTRAKGEGKTIFGKHEPTVETYMLANRLGCNVIGYPEFEDSKKNRINTHSFKAIYVTPLSVADNSIHSASSSETEVDPINTGNEVAAKLKDEEIHSSDSAQSDDLLFNLKHEDVFTNNVTDHCIVSVENGVQPDEQ
ncbi:hypothetical protein ACOME3_005776 [Neoechinorhynchus agilis]